MYKPSLKDKYIISTSEVKEALDSPDLDELKYVGMLIADTNTHISDLLENGDAPLIHEVANKLAEHSDDAEAAEIAAELHKGIQDLKFAQKEVHTRESNMQFVVGLDGKKRLVSTDDQLEIDQFAA